MRKTRLIFIIAALMIPILPLFGAAGRASDGFLFFVLLLGFLGIILGILSLVDCIKILIRRFQDSNGEKEWS